ncbi:MAG: phage major capsid protein [Fimbriimonadaceae bacterium]
MKQEKGMEFKKAEFEVTATNEAGDLVGYASIKGVVDAYGDTIADGAYSNLKEFVREGFVSVGHDLIGLPVGYIKSAKEDKKGLLVTMKFHGTAAAKEAHRMAQERFEAGKSVGLSIGYVPLKWRFEEKAGKRIRVLESIELKEFSLVTMPAAKQAEAVLVGAKAALLPSQKEEKQHVLEQNETKNKVEKGVVPMNRIAAMTSEDSVAQKLFATGQWESRVGGKFGEVELSGTAMEMVQSKATMSTGAGYSPQVIRDKAVVSAISRPPQLIDFLTIEPTDQNSIKFMKQTTRTNTASSKAEAAAFDEATMTYTESTVPVRKIGVYLPVTEEQLEDEPSVQFLVENDLKLMVRQKLDEQVTVGDGTGTNMTGLSSATGALTQARGTDSEFDQIMKAMTKVRTQGGARPNLVVLNAANYQYLALTKTADGVYIFGNPGDAPLQRIWGVQIVASEALPEGTGLVLDSDFVKLKLRKDLTVAASDSHSDFFISNILAMRAHVRAGLQILRDESICKLTGLRS